MGGGKSKTHESFAVTPATLAELPDVDPNTIGAGGDLVDNEPDPIAEFLELPEPAPPAPPQAAAADTAGAAAEETPDHGELTGEYADPVDTAGGEDPDPTPAEAANEPDEPAPVPSDEALTPVPDELPVGQGTGTALLVGGADLTDSTATLISYQDPAGPHEVLVATVDEHAEDKLLEALALSETKMIPVQVEEEVTGRLPVDEDHQLYEKLAKVAKSTNHHIKVGDGIPAHTVTNLANAKADLAALAATNPSDTDQAMIDHYQAAIEQIEQRHAAGYDTPYTDGGKIPTVAAYKHTGMATVTKYVPAPAEDLNPHQLATTARNASRIRPTLTAEGTSSWDGHERAKASKGKEYVADLGDGYQAVYRPYAANDPNNSEYSMRGGLEIIAPAGAGHGPELVNRLGQLNLTNRPMTATEGEWAYLNRNMWAQRLDNHPAVAAARADADGLEDAVEHVLFAERAHQAVGMNDAALHRFAKQIRLDAETKALPEKVRLLRDGIGKATGHPDGDALAASPGYQPTPRRTRAGLSWERFDVTGNLDGIRTAFHHKGLYHHVSGNNLPQVLRTGVLASTERRALMGIHPGQGISEGADKLTGGANSVFLRAGKQPTSGVNLFWDDPTTILRRGDWYAYNGDHFGSLNPTSGHSTNGQTRDPLKVAGFTAHNNEIMVRHGLDLLGAEAPSRIRCANPAQRQEILTMLANKNITHLAGRPVNQVVQ